MELTWRLGESVHWKMLVNCDIHQNLLIYDVHGTELPCPPSIYDKLLRNPAYDLMTISRCLESAMLGPREMISEERSGSTGSNFMRNTFSSDRSIIALL